MASAGVGGYSFHLRASHGVSQPYRSMLWRLSSRHRPGSWLP